MERLLMNRSLTKRARGVSLIEVLIALLVLAIGMLGTTRLLLGGWQDQRFAQRQLVAQALVADVGDHIRAVSGVAGLADEFSAAALERLAPAYTETQIMAAPATGADAPAGYRISLRWREADAADWQAEASTQVFAPEPVAGRGG
jgi:type IV pilus modification protein PilV